MNIVMKRRPIFDELSSNELLKKCLDSFTQNKNESFNAMIWERLPKTRYVGLIQLKLGVFNAVANFNIGRKASVMVYKQMQLVPGRYIVLGCLKLNMKRINVSNYDCSGTTKKSRQLLMMM